MNWGKKILFVYLFFVAGIVYLVIRSMGENQDLVTRDYYEQELRFQDRINQTHSADSINNAVVVTHVKDSIKLLFSDVFSQERITGSVWVYCPNDEKKDIKQQFVLSGGQRLFSLPYTSNGNRYVKVNWMSKGKEFYKEQQLFIND